MAAGFGARRVALAALATGFGLSVHGPIYGDGASIQSTTRRPWRRWRSLTALRGSSDRAWKTLAHLGASAAELAAAVQSIAELLQETVELTEGLYQPRFPLPRQGENDKQ